MRQAVNRNSAFFSHLLLLLICTLLKGKTLFFFFLLQIVSDWTKKPWKLNPRPNCCPLVVGGQRLRVRIHLEYVQNFHHVPGSSIPSPATRGQ